MRVCIFHNGNSQIVEFYKHKFSHLTFLGNLSESSDFSNPNGLWEICFADATNKNLTQATISGVHIIRHISDHNNDIKYIMPECRPFNYNDWLNFVVTKYISFADEIICDLKFDSEVTNEVVLITTGRTANSHFQNVLSKFNIKSFENKKELYPRLFNAASAILVWREQQWECLSSIWIAHNTTFIHNVNNQDELKLSVNRIDNHWIANDWLNMAQLALDYIIFFKYVINRPVSFITTKHVVSNYKSIHRALNYNKSNIIAEYEQTKQNYEHSEVVKILDLLYTKVQKQLPNWKEPV